MIYYNTDTQQDARFTNYPFTQASDKMVNDVFISNEMFVDVSICLPEAYTDIHIYSISYADQLVNIHITDATGQLQLFIPLTQAQQTAFVLNIHNTPCGMLQCSAQLYNRLLTAIQRGQGQQTSVDSRAFVFLPQCTSVALTNGLQSIDINGTVIGNGCINLKRNLVYTKGVGNAGAVSISMYPDDPYESDTRLRYANGAEAWNKHVIIKHNTLSDLRVLTKGDIQLVGVTDVQ